MTTKADTLQPDAIPYFAWDRNLTTRQLREKLHTAAQPERDRLCAWLLREAATEDVWVFLRPAEVAECLPRIGPMLGRKREFRTYYSGRDIDEVTFWRMLRAIVVEKRVTRMDGVWSRGRLGLTTELTERR